jgi:hypothetical protein
MLSGWHCTAQGMFMSIFCCDFQATTTHSLDGKILVVRPVSTRVP